MTSTTVECGGTALTCTDPGHDQPTELEAATEAELLELLPERQAAIAAADAAVHTLVAELRRRGVSYAVVGKALGVSRQAAWERFGRNARTEG